MTHRRKKRPFIRARRFLMRCVRSSRFQLLYRSFAIIILFLSTIFWSALGARLQQTNADQLVDAFLFENNATLHGALFPSQHSFLLKWPLFYLVKLLGYSPPAFMFVTVLCCLLTIGCLAYVLWRIERRPILLGTYYLALASMLTIVPIQPYAGSLLPVSLAMLTTRNIEYAFLLLAGLLVASVKTWRTPRLFGALTLLVLLVASDPLFAGIVIGGALGGWLLFVVFKKNVFAKLSLLWLVIGACATIIAELGLGFINSHHLTNFVGGSSPYGFVDSFKQFALNLLYGSLSLLTNIGANPVFNAPTIQSMPGAALANLSIKGAVPFIMNICLAVTMLWLGGKLLFDTLTTHIKKPTAGQKLSILLLAGLVATWLLFVATKHYQVVDARYMGLSIFALSIAAATALRKLRWQQQRGAIVIGGLLFISTCFGITWSAQSYQTQNAAYHESTSRDHLVERALKKHGTTTLIGDYWRVMPVKGNYPSLTVVPLENCTEPRQVLSSTAWNDDADTRRFARLVTLEGSITGFPNCSLAQLVETYGLPDSSTIIAGSTDHPREVLLFYDTGKKAPPNPTEATANVLPIALNKAHATCEAQTVMNIVAHEDDDLLFMNPDLQHDITAGMCIRTVYITAGDAGEGTSYWLAREQGSTAAYDQMIGHQNEWVRQTVRLPSGQYITIATPVGNPSISLLFLHLPDGGLNGNGIGSRHQSLNLLGAGAIGHLASVDGQSTYTSRQLTSALTDLMTLYHPNVIRTQSDYSGQPQFYDHGDHRAVSRLVTTAWKAYSLHEQTPLTYYLGYSNREFPENVTDEDLARKQAAFFAYGKHDGAVCRAIEDCDPATYGAYLPRQYTYPN